MCVAGFAAGWCALCVAGVAVCGGVHKDILLCNYPVAVQCSVAALSFFTYKCKGTSAYVCCVCVLVCIHLRVHVRVRLRVRVSVSVSVSVSVCVCVFAYVCV